MDYGVAALYGIFAILYAVDWYRAEAESDAIAASMDEAKGALDDDERPTCGGAGSEELPRNIARSVFGKAFVALFIAEWGDRTQIAMIGLHSSEPLTSMCLGSTKAFCVLTLSAVMVASWVGNYHLSERVLHGVGCVSFAFFALLSLWEAVRA